jgi:transposase
MQQSRDDDLLKGPQIDQDMELSRLRKEHRILREERETLKKSAVFSASQKLSGFP